MNWRFTSEEKNMFRSLPRALLLCEKNLIEIQSGHEKICLDSIHEIGVGSILHLHYILPNTDIKFDPLLTISIYVCTIWNSHYGYVLDTYEQSIHAQCTFEIYSKIPKEHWNFPNYHFCILNYDGGKDHNVMCNACIHIYIYFYYIPNTYTCKQKNGKKVVIIVKS